MFNVFSVVDGGPESQPVTSGLSLDFCSLKHLFALPVINIFHPFAALVIWGFWGPAALVDLNRQLSSMNEAVNYSGHGRGLGCGNERSSEKILKEFDFRNAENQTQVRCLRVNVQKRRDERV